MRELPHRSIIYFTCNGYTIATVYNSPFVPPNKSRVEVKNGDDEINLYVIGEPTYRFGTAIATAVIYVPVIHFDEKMEE